MQVLALAAAFQESPAPGSEAGGVIALLFGGVGLLIGLAFLAVMIVSGWKIFEKAGQPGWAAIVPIYNLVVLVQILSKPIWWVVLVLVPCVGIIAGIVLTVELAKAFGKGVGFAIGMLVLPFIFYPMLAFSDARYTAPPPA